MTRRCRGIQFRQLRCLCLQSFSRCGNLLQLDVVSLAYSSCNGDAAQQQAEHQNKRHKMPGVGSSHGDHPFCRSVCQFVRLFQLYAISLAKSSKKEERTWQPHVLFLWTNPGALWGQLQICSNQKAREFARSRSHRPASFCWCVREAAPCTPRNSTLLSCTHMPGNCPKNVKQGLLQNVFFATDSVLKVKDSGRKHRNSCLLPLKY